MGMHKYVGARYVPRFTDVNDGNWSSSYSYEALTVVKHGNDYYTSRIPVPTGVDILNTTYWVKTGDYNGAISDLTNRVEDMEHTVAKVSADKWIVIGDSYGTGFNAYDSIVTPNMMTNIVNYSGKTLNTDIFTTAGNGSGFCHQGSSGTTFLEQLENLVAAKSLDQDSDITDVIAVGGWNDIPYSRATIEAAISTFITYCKTTFGDSVRVHIGMIGNSLYQTKRSTLQQFVLPAYASASKYGGVYMRGVENIMHDYGRLSSDGLHPNQAGAAELAYGIVNAIKTGSCEALSGFLNATVEMTAANVESWSTLGISSRLMNDTVFAILSASMTLKTALSIGNQVEICRIKGGAFVGLIGGAVNIPCTFKDSSNNFHDGTAKIITSVDTSLDYVQEVIVSLKVITTNASDVLGCNFNDAVICMPTLQA